MAADAAHTSGHQLKAKIVISYSRKDMAARLTQLVGLTRAQLGKQGDCQPIGLYEDLPMKSPNPKNGYASAIGLCKDSRRMQSRKPSNCDFCRPLSI